MIYSDSKKEEKKVLNRNNSASYIERKEIRLFKTDLKSQEFLRSKLDKESIQLIFTFSGG
jgi:hypothetical protein